MQDFKLVNKYLINKTPWKTIKVKVRTGRGIHIVAYRLVRFNIQSELQCTEFTDSDRSACSYPSGIRSSFTVNSIVHGHTAHCRYFCQIRLYDYVNGCVLFLNNDQSYAIGIKNSPCTCCTYCDKHFNFRTTAI